MARSDLLTLLLSILLSQASCDWVEISQQHHVKPARATRVYPQLSIKEVERTTKANRVFVNNSLPNPGWNTGAVHRVPSSEVKKLKDSDVVRSKPINFKEDKSELDPRKIFVGPTKPTSEIRKRPNEDNNRYNGNVFYNKDNVKRITFISTEESLKPLEVLNLSDLGYDEDELPAIEVDDFPLNVDQFEHTRHVTSVISTEEEVDNFEKQSNTSLKGSKYSFSTRRAPSKVEDVKVTNEKPATKAPNMNFVDKNSPKSSRKETNSNFNLKTMKMSNTDDRNKVVILKDKPSNHSKSTHPEKIKVDVLKDKKNCSSSQSTTQRTQDAKSNERSKIIDNNKLKNNGDSLPQLPLEKPTQEKLKLKKNFLRIEDLPTRSKTRSPEEVMLEEILHESGESFEDVDQRTALEHTNTGTVKKVSNKSTITKVYPKRDKPKNNVGAKPVAELRDQGTDGADNVNSEENINSYKKSINTITTSSTSERPFLTAPTIPTNKEYTTEKEIEEFDMVQLNSPTPTLVESSESDNNEYEEMPDFDITEEETQGIFQEDKKVLVLTTSTDNHKETRTKEKPIMTEKTIGTKIEATTKASSMQQIKRTTDKNKETDRLDSKTPPKIDKNTREEVKKHKQEDKTTAEETLANDTTADTLGILVKVLKLVTETISRNTRKTLKGKLRYLEELRDTIMASIEQRLEAAFPDDTPRRARSAPHPRGHHVEFPSSESALMTISFLTFAVFLIKLVLQLIQAYKYKAMMPAVVATVGRAYQEYSKTKSDDTK